MWPENEERVLAGEAQPHRFVARSLQTLHERVVAEEVAHQEGGPTDAAAESPIFFHIDMDCFFVSVAVGGCRSEPVAVTR